jgi:hypothetical protein
MVPAPCELNASSIELALIAMLMDRTVDFVCCDNPAATKLTIHILGRRAQREFAPGLCGPLSTAARTRGRRS